MTGTSKGVRLSGFPHIIIIEKIMKHIDGATTIYYFTGRPN